MQAVQKSSITKIRGRHPCPQMKSLPYIIYTVRHFPVDKTETRMQLSADMRERHRGKGKGGVQSSLSALTAFNNCMAISSQSPEKKHNGGS